MAYTPEELALYKEMKAAGSRPASTGPAKRPSYTAEELAMYKELKAERDRQSAGFSESAARIANQPTVEKAGNKIFTPTGELAALTGAGVMAAKAGLKSVPAVAAMGVAGGALELGSMYEEALRGAPETPKTAIESLGRLAQGAYRGASGELAGQVIGKLVPMAALGAAEGVDKLPERMINSLIKPRSRDFIYGKNPGRGVVEEGIIATSFDDLGAKVTAKKAQIGAMYDPILNANSGKVLSLDKAIDPIDKAIASAGKYGKVNKEVITRLKDVRADLINNIIAKDTTGKWGLTPRGAMDLKRELAEITKFTGNESDDKIVNSALKETYHYIDSAMDAAIPGIKKINERYANMIGAESAIKWRNAILERQNVFHIPELMTGAAAGLGTGSMGAGVLAGLAYKAAGTPIGKTVGAQLARGGAAVARGAIKAGAAAGKTGIGQASGTAASRYIGQSAAAYMTPSTQEAIRRRYMGLR